jgi:hypothetical protein
MSLNVIFHALFSIHFDNEPVSPYAGKVGDPATGQVFSEKTELAATLYHTDDFP